jgi:hypothetical protein
VLFRLSKKRMKMRRFVVVELQGSAGRAFPAELSRPKNIENNPMHSSVPSPAWMLWARKHFDTSGKSPALFQRRATFKPLMVLPDGLFGTI